jgi:hypothetical protein
MEIKNCPCLFLSVVESNTIAEFGTKNRQLRSAFPSSKQKIHAAIIEYPSAAAFVACGIAKDNSRARAAPLSFLPRLGLALARLK